MKPARSAILFWTTGLLLLGGTGLFAWHTAGEHQRDREAREARLDGLASDVPRRDWQPRVQDTGFTTDNARLSPIARPREPEPPVEATPPPAETPRSDEQLRAELEAELNRRLTLLRVVVSNSTEYPSCAFLVCGGTRLQWFRNMHLKDEYANAPSPALRALAWDLRVLAIEDDGVLVHAASFERPDRSFDVRIGVHAGKPTGQMLSARFESEHALQLPPLVQTPPDPAPEPPTGDKPLDFSEFDEAALDELARYVMPTEQGLAVSPELPEDSPARRYGLTGGEIVKTVNGLAVRTFSDLRRLVRTQYDDGARAFVVGYERDGVPHSRTFKVAG
jgi:hypothetical protein